MQAVRIDKWLWAARFFKTRSLAKTALEGGHVHYNGQRAKPSRNVEVGGKLRIRKGQQTFEIEILALSEQRGPAPVAQALYSETPESVAERQRQAELRKLAKAADATPQQKPNKKQRRNIRAMKHGADL
ncbi:RNA-binding S4 domain-containing protein [Salinibius halmophilus]|uniref:RNA-binding S4 domain-containing protein n=1 Tax=Salinibius halmophilus TaxID=1853216 RepID=UPI000E662F8B|nr:S4 domain-containing protein [Salinibius halmophilus]